MRTRSAFPFFISKHKLLSRATLVRIAREHVQDGRGVGVGRCGRGELSAGYADGDVAEGSQGADEFADADPGGWR